ncbi:MAG: hypothetical protein L0F96_02475 [Lactococcus lactis]|nr:hypothetical protein [Lactococcus lactis]
MYRPRYLRKKKEEKLAEIPNLVVEHRNITKFIGKIKIRKIEAENLPEKFIEKMLLKDMIEKTYLWDFLEVYTEYIPETDEISCTAILKVVN